MGYTTEERTEFVLPVTVNMLLFLPRAPIRQLFQSLTSPRVVNNLSPRPLGLKLLAVTSPWGNYVISKLLLAS